MGFFKPPPKLDHKSGFTFVKSAERIGEFFDNFERRCKQVIRHPWKREVTRPAVRLEDFEHAVEVLRDAGRVNVDQYLAQINPRLLMAQPLGPTPDCLTANELDKADLSDPLGRVQRHLAGCPVCTESFKAYELVKRRPLGPESRLPKAWLEVPAAMTLTRDTREFDLVIHTIAGHVIDETSLRLHFQDLLKPFRCEHKIRLQDDPAVGSSYVCKWSGWIDPSQTKSLAPEGEFVDWVQISGRTTAGVPFSERTLIKFHLGASAASQV